MKNFKFAALAIARAVLLSLILTKSGAQPPFNKISDYQQGIEWGWTILVKSDSSYIVNASGINATNLQGLFFDFYDKNGNLSNRKTYFQEGVGYYAGLSSSMKCLNDSEFILFGSEVEYYPFDHHVTVIKFDSLGDTIFFKTIETGNLDGAYNSAQTYDNGFALTGFTTPDTATSTNVLVMKVDSSGDFVWSKSYGGSESDGGYSIFEISGKRLIVTGIKRYTLNNYSPWIIVTDSAGNILNQKEWNTGALYCGGNSLALSLNPNYYFLKGCLDTLINPYDHPYCGFVAKIDTDFNIIWKAIYNSPDFKSFYIVKQLADSSIVGIGFNSVGASYNTQGWIAKLDKDGNKLWEHSYEYGNSTFNYFADFEQTADKGFIITGSTDGPTSQDIWLVKLDSIGCLDTGNCYTGDLTIEVSKKNDFRIAPNPAYGIANLVYNIPDKNAQTKFIITDLAGKKIFYKTVDANKNAELLDVSQWQQGVYVCSLFLDEQFASSEKFIVIK